MQFFQKDNILTPNQLWLLEHGRRWLDSSQNAEKASLDAAQKTMLQQQIQWRKRSRHRFPNPEKWLWTDRSLAQASDWMTAQFKTLLFPKEALVVDACCGAGVDAIALANRGPVIAVDCDSWMAALAADNARAMGRSLRVFHETFSEDSLRGALWLHIDPDRRSEGRKTLDTDQFSPGLSEIFQRLDGLDGAAIKIAPASQFNDSVSDFVNSKMSRIWIGNRGECRQQVLLYGGCRLPKELLVESGQWFYFSSGLADQNVGPRLAEPTAAESLEVNWTTQQNRQEKQQPAANQEKDQPVIRAAILLQQRDGRDSHYGAIVFVGGHDCLEIRSPATQQLGEFVYDLDNVLFASSLHEDWASRHGLMALEDPLGYYTSSRKLLSPWSQTFRVLEELPWDDRKVRKWLRSNQIGKVEIKCRLVRIEADAVGRRLRSSLPGTATLLVTRVNNRVRCIACQRVTESDLMPEFEQG